MRKGHKPELELSPGSHKHWAARGQEPNPQSHGSAARDLIKTVRDILRKSEDLSGRGCGQADLGTYLVGE